MKETEEELTETKINIGKGADLLRRLEDNDRYRSWGAHDLVDHRAEALYKSLHRREYIHVQRKKLDEAQRLRRDLANCKTPPTKVTQEECTGK